MLVVTTSDGATRYSGATPQDTVAAMQADSFDGRDLSLRAYVLNVARRVDLQLDTIATNAELCQALLDGLAEAELVYIVSDKDALRDALVAHCDQFGALRDAAMAAIEYAAIPMQTPENKPEEPSEPEPLQRLRRALQHANDTLRSLGELLETIAPIAPIGD